MQFNYSLVGQIMYGLRLWPEIDVLKENNCLVINYGRLLSNFFLQLTGLKILARLRCAIFIADWEPEENIINSSYYVDIKCDYIQLVSIFDE